VRKWILPAKAAIACPKCRRKIQDGIRDRDDKRATRWPEIEAAIAAVDPSVVIDIAPEGDRLRMPTVIGTTELVALLRLTGISAAPGRGDASPADMLQGL